MVSRRGRRVTDDDRDPYDRPARSMPTYAEPPVTFVRGAGTELWDDRGQAVPRLPVRPGGDLARPRPPGGGRGAGRAGQDAAARLEPLRQRRRAGGGGHARPARSAAGTTRRRPGLLLQLGGRGQRVRHQAGPQVGRARAATWWSAPTDSFHGRTLATLHATGQPAKHEPFEPLPEASGTSPTTTSTPSTRPATRPGSAAVLSSRSRARRA